MKYQTVKQYIITTFIKNNQEIKKMAERKQVVAIVDKIYGPAGTDRRLKNQKRDTLVQNVLSELDGKKVCVLGAFKHLDQMDKQIIHNKKMFNDHKFEIELYKRVAKLLLKCQGKRDVITQFPPNFANLLNDVANGHEQNMRKIVKQLKLRSIFRTQERQASI